MPMFIQMDSPVGRLTLAEERGQLTEVRFGEEADGQMQNTPLLIEARRQLEAYFRGALRAFDLPLAPAGTPFQQKVWRALLTIPYGETRAYGQIAQAVGQPGAARAVGMANHANPIPLIIPCHRVIGADGRLTGYGGGLNVKKFLLELEESVTKA